MLYILLSANNEDDRFMGAYESDTFISDEAAKAAYWEVEDRYNQLKRLQEQAYKDMCVNDPPPPHLHGSLALAAHRARLLASYPPLPSWTTLQDAVLEARGWRRVEYTIVNV